jgi:hypothetical protein
MCGCSLDEISKSVATTKVSEKTTTKVISYSDRGSDRLVYIYISGWLDGARKGGCSLLLVGAGKLGSWSFLQVAACK